MSDFDKRASLMIDSGVGGISVLARASQLLPEENFIYYADIANAPYGEKQPDQIVKLLHRIIGEYAASDIKAIILACNTATSAAAAVLRSELSIPVIGMEPALKPAVMESEGQILVIATSLTLREEKFRKLSEKYGTGKDIVSLPCPGLMELVEVDPAGDAVEDYLYNLLTPYADTAESLVLGCTHYVFLRPLIQKMFPKFRIYDGNDGVVHHLAHVLEENGATGGSGQIDINCSFTAPDERSAYLEKCRQMFAFGREL